MDICYIIVLKDEMMCRVVNFIGIMFMVIDIVLQWLFYVDFDNYVLMQYFLIFNVIIFIIEVGLNVIGVCVFIYINVLVFFCEYGLMYCFFDIIVNMLIISLSFLCYDFGKNLIYLYK